ncbi:ExbD/TolR family protein [Methylobacterium sp. J-077]|uniref:ExbD/TolR family protein n=1 Tax=Methylobacterium sp. J-077 TaxID=2836656 RepID=UPI001FB8B0B3|nr:biopolymer transporter ExbD [Methylobacterium sp. J-077]MCJ2127156.1 biopolymer transporter ExbD [Methylobacterium sp. J-077]
MAFASNSSGPYRPSADINVTPLIDVMLVLLIVFMVTEPLLTTGMKVNLPQAQVAKPVDPKEPAVVAVSKDGKLFIGKDEIEAERLVPAVVAAIENDLSRVIHLRGDKDAAYGDVIKVMDLLAKNGMTHIAIITSKNGAQGGANAGRTSASAAAGSGEP